MRLSSLASLLIQTFKTMGYTLKDISREEKENVCFDLLQGRKDILFGCDVSILDSIIRWFNLDLYICIDGEFYLVNN